MVASDEKCDEWGDVSRPMTLIELCRSGPMKGVMHAHFHRYRNIADYQGSVWAGLLIPLMVMLPFVQSHTKWAGLGFAALSLGNLAVQELRVVSNNIRVFMLIQRLKENPLAIALDSDRPIHRLISDPIPGTFHIFQPKQRSISRNASWGLPVFSRSDGMGSNVVFLEFEDDHDRVMFRLAQ